MTKFELLFWIAIALLGYTYLAYPLLIWLWSRLCRPHRKLAIEPNVSLLLAAGESEDGLRGSIENLLALDYPARRLEVVVACGSREAEAVAQSYAGRGVKVVNCGFGRGKAALLNELVPRLWGDVAVLVDAGHHVERGALRALVTHFADPRTGAVSGREVAVDEAAHTGVAEEFEDFLRGNEARVHSTVCTTGALFAVRKRLYSALPEGTVIEDALLSLDLWRRGYRVHYEPEARVIERGRGGSLLQRIRAPGDALQLLRRACGCLNPSSNPLWLQTFSHRFLRLLGPLCLVTAFAANLTLLDQPGYQLLFGLQALFYGVALAGTREAGRRGALLNIPCAICQLNWALVKDAARALFASQQNMRWEKAES